MSCHLRRCHSSRLISSHLVSFDSLLFHSARIHTQCLSTRAPSASSHSRRRRGNPTPLYSTSPWAICAPYLVAATPMPTRLIGCWGVGVVGCWSYLYPKSKHNKSQLSLRIGSTGGSRAGRTGTWPCGMLSAPQQQPSLLLVSGIWHRAILHARKGVSSRTPCCRRRWTTANIPRFTRNGSRSRVVGFCLGHINLKTHGPEHY